MALRPIVRALVVPVLGLSLSGITPGDRRDVVNINLAPSELLRFLPGVGEQLARLIVEYRRERGPFKRPEDLMQVRGIGEKFFNRLKPHVVVSGPTTLTTKL